MFLALIVLLVTVAEATTLFNETLVLGTTAVSAVSAFDPSASSNHVTPAIKCMNDKLADMNVERQEHLTANNEMTPAYVCDPITTNMIFARLLALAPVRTQICSDINSTVETNGACEAGFMRSIIRDPRSNFNVAPCPPGYFCVFGADCAIACLLGSYCPSPGVYNETTDTCSTDTQAKWDNTICGGQKIYNNKCPAGSYCPVPNEIVECPEGYFCREGSVEPKKCPPLTLCARGSGSAVKNFFAFLVLIFIIFGLVVVYLAAVLLLRNQKVRKLLGFHTLFDGSTAGAMTEKANGLELKTIVSAAERETAADADEESGVSATQNISSPISIDPNPFLMEVSFRNLGLKLNNKSEDVVLRGVSGRCRAGRVTAIMGPSGAGKTSFLNTLCGKASYGTITGELFVNGKKVETLKDYSRCLGFVPQEDTMIRNLTVRETLQFYARLRLPPSVQSEARRRVVEKTVEMLKLPKSTLDKEIGDEAKRGISGGQRKRVNIGIEVVADPTILFLDEPTSGLDSTTSMQVIGALRDLSRSRGTTIVAVLHQPRYEIFRLFDEVILLAPGGRAVYVGPTANALGHFEKIGLTCPGRVNPADFFMDVISETPIEDPDSGAATELVPVDRLVEFWEQESNFDPTIMHDSIAVNSPPFLPEPMPNFVRQMYYFLRRALIQQYREFSILIKDMLVIFLAGTGLGVLFLDKFSVDKVIPMAFMSSIAVGLTASLEANRTLGGERVVFWRECGMGTNKLAYYLGKLLSECVRLFLGPLLYSIVFVLIAGLPATTTMVYAILLMCQFAGSGFGYLVSVSFPSNPQTIIAFGTLVFAMFAGLSPKLPEMSGALFITYFNPTRWTMQALFLAVDDRLSDVYILESCATLGTFGYLSVSLPICLVSMLILGLSFRVGAFAVLILKDRDKQV